MGHEVDRRISDFRREDRGVCLRGRDLLLRKLLLHLLAEEARAHAGFNLLQRVDLSRRRPSLRLRLPDLYSIEDEAHGGAREVDCLRRGGDREGVCVRRASVRVGGDEP